MSDRSNKRRWKIVARDASVRGLVQPRTMLKTGRPWRAQALLEAVNHHVSDHLAEDPCAGRDPADDFPVMASQRESDADNPVVSAGEFRAVRAPTHILAQCRDLTVMLAQTLTTGMAPEQQGMALHQVD